MKKFIKKNKIFFLTLIVLLIISSYSAIKYNETFVNYDKKYIEIKEYIETHPELNIKLPTYQKPYIPDTYAVFDHIIVDTNMNLIIYLVPFLIMLSGIYSAYYKIKSGYIKNEVTRKEYKKIIFDLFLNSWKNSLLMIIFLTSIFLFAFLISGHFNYSESLKHQDGIYIEQRYLSNLPYYIFTYISNLTILSIWIINLGLIYVKKGYNFFVTLALSYLTYHFSVIIIEIFLGTLIEQTFPQVIPYGWANSLAINNFWVYDSVVSLSFMRMLAIILAIISSIVVWIIFKNKESVIINAEK